MPRPKSKRPWSEVVKAAPGPLALVQAFLNTDDGIRRLDEIGSPEALTGWLRHRKLVGAGFTATAEDVQRTHEVREALRTVIRAHHLGRLPEEAALRLNRETETGAIRVLFAPDGATRFEGASDGVASALAQILAAFALGQEAGLLTRFKICDNPRCGRAYYDRSRNGRGRWCSMEICGNRAKANTRRRRAARARASE